MIKLHVKKYHSLEESLCQLLEMHKFWGYNEFSCEVMFQTLTRSDDRNNERSHLIMGFVDLLKERAKKSIKTIVLPETEDMRTIEATDKILKEGVAKIILIGNEEEINKKAAEGGFDISGATIVDPETSDRTQAYIDKFVELRAKKGMTPEKAKEILHTQYPYYGVMMVKMGDADGMVSGACHSTADTLRPCLQILKTKPGTKLVSAFFLIVVPDCEYGANGAFVFADSGLNQNPTPEELSAIAASSAESFQLLVQEEPVVAMLSHSTKGSAKHPDVDKMVEATRIAKEEHPELKLDGEFQLDAAIVPSVGASKAPLQVKQTFLYSLTLMQETSDINLLSVLEKQKLTDLLHRVSQNQSMTSPEDALQMISLVLLLSQLYSARLKTNKNYIF
jgi:phosphate acetyltransferase